MSANTSTVQAQLRTLATAVHNGEEWSREDIDMVANFRDETAEEVAIAIGRTAYAVQSMRELLDRGEREARDSRRRRSTVSQPFFQFATGWQDRMVATQPLD